MMMYIYRVLVSHLPSRVELIGRPGRSIPFGRIDRAKDLSPHSLCSRSTAMCGVSDHSHMYMSRSSA